MRRTELSLEVGEQRQHRGLDLVLVPAAVRFEVSLVVVGSQAEKKTFEIAFPAGELARHPGRLAPPAHCALIRKRLRRPLTPKPKEGPPLRRPFAGKERDQLAAMPSWLPPPGTAATWTGVSEPPAPMLKTCTVPNSPLCTYRNCPLAAESVAPGMPDAATAATRTTVPSALTRNWLTEPLPVLDVYSYPRADVAQQSAAWVSETGALTGVIVLSELTVKVCSELVPAKFKIIRPAWSKENAKGTGASAFLTGVADSRPSGPAEKTSTVLCVLVVTIRCSPSGVNPASAGELRKNGTGALASKRVRVEPSIGCSRPPAIR